VPDNDTRAIYDPSNNSTARDHITTDRSAADTGTHHCATNRINFAHADQHDDPANDAGRNDNDNSNSNSNSNDNCNDNNEGRHDHQQRLAHHRVADVRS
jgi:hypothetical protein